MNRNSELELLRCRQAERVMFEVGPLLDAWDGLPNDTFDRTDKNHNAFLRAMARLIRAVEGT